MISLTLEAPSANTATLGVRASTYELGGEGDTNIQYITSISKQKIIIGTGIAQGTTQCSVVT